MRKLFGMFIVLVIGLFLFGCDNEIDSTLFVSDMKQSREGYVTHLNTIITFEVPSENEYKRSKGYFENLLNEYFNDTLQSMELKQDMFEWYVEAEVAVPLDHISDIDYYRSALIGYLYNPEERQLLVEANPNMIQDLKQEIDSMFHTSFNFSDLDVRLVVLNDYTEQVELGLFPAYVYEEDGTVTPNLGLQEVTITGFVEVRFSNIMLASLEQGNTIPVLVW